MRQLLFLVNSLWSFLCMNRRFLLKFIMMMMMVMIMKMMMMIMVIMMVMIR